MLRNKTKHVTKSLRQANYWRHAICRFNHFIMFVWFYFYKLQGKQFRFRVQSILCVIMTWFVLPTRNVEIGSEAVIGNAWSYGYVPITVSKVQCLVYLSHRWEIVNILSCFRRDRISSRNVHIEHFKVSLACAYNRSLACSVLKYESIFP